VLALVAVVAATLRHRVFGIEVVVGRAFLYTTMLGLVALLYGAIVGLSTLLAGDARRSVLTERIPPKPSAAAAG
jgi:hypothetical protein